MTDEQKPEQKASIHNIQDRQFKSIANKNYYAVLDEYEVLRLKFYNEIKLTPEETLRFITLCKYFIIHGHSDSMKLGCQLFFDKYLKNL